MEQLDRIIGRLADVVGEFCGWLTVAIVILVFVEVISRYIFHSPLMVADEFSGYALVALSFLGAAFAWRQGSHVRITILVDRLPPTVARWIRLISLLFVALFVSAMVYACAGFIKTSFKFHMASSSWLQFPLQGPHLTMGIGFIFLLIVVIFDLVRSVAKVKRNGEDDEVNR